MKYFLKKTKPSSKGEYLQIYASRYIQGKGSRNACHKSLGYVSDLKASGIEDPIAWARRQVEELNSAAEPGTPQIGERSARTYAGHFLAKSMIDRLGVDSDIETMTSGRKADYRMSDFVRALVYAQILSPGSKLAATERVLPSVYGAVPLSYDQILDGIEYIGGDYQKYIECFNHGMAKNWERKTGKAYFDCTNYYFEIDLEDGDRRKGPSKENRKSPIIGQALMLDEDQIPIAMSMYPGNESEKPYLRKTVEDMKSRYGIESRIVEIADKGLNCAKNIYYLHKEGKDGYIFSKSFRGKAISEQDKEWVVLDTPQQGWTDVKDEKGNLLFRYKETVGKYGYRFRDDDGSEVSFTTREKRIATFNPGLAEKQSKEIDREVEKAVGLTAKGLAREEIGDRAKYLDIVAEGDSRIDVRVNQEKVAEAKRYAGYNLLVTSETGMKAEDVYRAYHGLWRIENSFRIMKTHLEARPVFLQTKERIYGHFLICYLALTVIRLLETKTFKDEITVDDLMHFVREYTVTETAEGTYINNSTRSDVYEKIKATLGILKLGNLYLTKKDVENLFRTEV